MRFLKASSLFVLLSTTALADGFEFIPKWRLVTLPLGEKAACYDFEQAKVLAGLEADLRACATIKTTLPELKKAHEGVVAALNAQITAEVEKSLELTSQRDALMTALRVSERDRIKAENDPTKWIGWFVAAGVGLIAVGVVSGVLLTTPRAP